MPLEVKEKYKALPTLGRERVIRMEKKKQNLKLLEVRNKAHLTLSLSLFLLSPENKASPPAKPGEKGESLCKVLWLSPGEPSPRLGCEKSNLV